MYMVFQSGEALFWMNRYLYCNGMCLWQIGPKTHVHNNEGEAVSSLRNPPYGALVMVVVVMG